MTKLHAAAALALVAQACTPGCSDSGTPESRVRDLIAQAETAAEARDLTDVMDLVADSYADKRGLDKAAVRDLMRRFFFVNQSVHLLVRVEDVQFPADDVATATVTVGTLGRRSQDDWSYAADIYDFEVRLRKVDDEWRLQSAEWLRNRP